MSRNDVKLAWAVVEGRLAHISEFRDLPRGTRPPAMCEHCGRRLIMKLGPQRAHHFAHYSDVDCPLRESETARHYNTKQLLASKLREADELSVVTKCRHPHCPSDLTSQAAEDWDEVRVEPLVDPVRPDILLLRAGAPTLAIEVFATHAVPEAKVAQLADLGIPWIEVEAGGKCDDWEPGALMPAIRHESELAPKLCFTHSQPAQIRPTSPAAPRVRKASLSSTHTHPDHGERWRLRVVDCYPHEGPRVRKVFAVYCMDLNSEAVRLRLVDGDLVDSRVIDEVCASARSTESLRKVHDLLEQYLRREFERFDSPRSWLDSRELPENPAKLYCDDFMPVKYRRDQSGAWTVSV